MEMEPSSVFRLCATRIPSFLSLPTTVSPSFERFLLVEVWTVCYVILGFPYGPVPKRGASAEGRAASVARSCIVCGKRTETGSKVSHSNRKTRRTFLPNLQKMRLKINGSVRRAYVCTKCLKAGKVQRAV